MLKRCANTAKNFRDIVGNVCETFVFVFDGHGDGDDGDGGERKSFRDVKHYKRRKRWLS